jgi:hypothetical protein
MLLMVIVVMPSCKAFTMLAAFTTFMAYVVMT